MFDSLDANGVMRRQLRTHGIRWPVVLTTSSQLRLFAGGDRGGGSVATQRGGIGRIPNRQPWIRRLLNGIVAKHRANHLAWQAQLEFLKPLG